MLTAPRPCYLMWDRGRRGACGIRTALQPNGSLIALFHEAGSVVPFSILQHFNPYPNTLQQIGSNECTLVCQYDHKPVQHTRLRRNRNREHFNLEHWHPYKAFFSFCRGLVCILGTEGLRHTANLPPATSRALSKQFWPSDLQAIYEIWIIPRWGRKWPGILCSLCDECERWVGERQMIAYGMAKEWEAITSVICSWFLCSSANTRA